MFLLDTNVISELRKSRAGTADHGVFDWANSVSSLLMFVSVITLHELEHGVRLAEDRDPARGSILRNWLEHGVLPAFSDRIVDIDSAIARRAAEFHVPNPAPFRDALIGATALVRGMQVVTRNVRDFERFAELKIIDPWTTSENS